MDDDAKVDFICKAAGFQKPDVRPETILNNDEMLRIIIMTLTPRQHQTFADKLREITGENGFMNLNMYLAYPRQKALAYALTVGGL